MTTHYSFLSWVRGGAAAVITEPDADDLPGHAKVPIELKLTTTPTEAGGKPDFINLDIHLYGPSDIIGIDPHQIIRTEPRHQTSNFMPNYLAAIEFDRPDFPWLFTPAKAEAQQGRLRPWLCLVVVRKQEGVLIGTQPGAPLPVLDIHDPAIANDELPDLSESWAWAHSQVLHEQGDANLKKALTEQPNLAISRLLCPRRLEAHQSYVACLVPTFEVGRKVGLGETLSETENDINTQVLKPAWSDPQDIKLPVYYHWEFSTGEAGDFEDLAKKLGPQALPAGAGSRKLYIGQSGVPAPSGQTDWEDLDSLDFAGVFRPAGFPSPVPPDRDAPQSWVAQLKNVLNASDWTSTGESSDAPIVGPPIYARFQQSLQRLPDAAAGWVNELNLDARNRTAAGLGVLCVQTLQEALMHSAWQQLGDFQQAQQLIRQSELAQETSNAIYTKHLRTQQTNGNPVGRPLSRALFYQMTAPAHARIVVRDQGQSAAEGLPPTLARWAEAQHLPSLGTISTFRKLSRSGGPIMRRMEPKASAGQRAQSESAETRPLDLRTADTGATNPTAFEISAGLTAMKPLGKVRLDLIGQAKQWQDNAENSSEADRARADRMQMAINKLQAHLKKLTDAPRAEERTPKLFDQEMQDDLKAKIDPKHVLPPLLISRIHAPANGSSSASAQSSEEGVPGVQAPIAHPTFPQSMYEVIRELKPDMLMAGADQLKENSVTLMETNPEFIEAFMVGLNHEMARELLWRGYPTDQRGTYFQSFWSQGKADINKIHTWDLNSRLGQNLEDGHTSANGNGDQLALIIRAELLRRFPNTVIYAVKAKTERTLCKDPDDREHPDEPVEVYPIHRGQLTDDAMFILFNLTSEQVKSSPTQNGWFFMFQQQPTEARFGLDVTASGELLTWDDLAWAHLETDPGRYISVARAVDSLSSINDPNGPKWNFNGAHMADIFLQKPYRVGIHADNLLS